MNNGNGISCVIIGGFIIILVGVVLLLTMLFSGEVTKANTTCYEGTIVITSEEQLEDITEMIDDNYSGGLFEWFGKPYYIKSQSNGEYILDYRFLSRDSHLPLDKYIK